MVYHKSVVLVTDSFSYGFIFSRYLVLLSMHLSSLKLWGLRGLSPSSCRAAPNGDTEKLWRKRVAGVDDAMREDERQRMRECD